MPGKTVGDAISQVFTGVAKVAAFLLVGLVVLPFLVFPELVPGTQGYRAIQEEHKAQQMRGLCEAAGYSVTLCRAQHPNPSDIRFRKTVDGYKAKYPVLKIVPGSDAAEVTRILDRVKDVIGPSGYKRDVCLSEKTDENSGENCLVQIHKGGRFNPSNWSDTCYRRHTVCERAALLGDYR